MPFPFPSPFRPQFFFFVNTLGKQTLIRIAQPIRVSNYHEAVFSFLDDRHFVVPSISSKRPNEIVLDIFELHHPQHHGQQEQEQEQQQQQSEPTPIRSYVLSLADALTNVCSLRFFPDVSARCGASTGHFYADVSKRKLGIQIEAISKSTDTMTLHELLVPLRALMDLAPKHTPLPCRAVSVDYEPCLGRRLAHAVRLTEEHPYKVSVDMLPPALRDVGARQLRFAICCGALLVFEVCYLGVYSLG